MRWVKEGDNFGRERKSKLLDKDVELVSRIRQF